MKINLVTFYADGGKSRPAIAGDLDGPNQISLMAKSAKKFHKEAVITVLTDNLTTFQNLPEDIVVKRHNIDLSRIMFERMRLQRDFLTSDDFDAPTVFVDTDVLFCSNIEELFEDDFDLGFTWRKSDEMPINGGVIYINNRRKQVTSQLFNRIFETYSEKYSGTHAWYGDQFAIVNVLSLPFEEVYRSPTVDRHGGRIRLLPCAQFNYSPNGERPDLRDFKKDAKVYHFKGMSRRIMGLFWRFHLAQDENDRFRKLALQYHNVRLRLQRRSYRAALKKDIKRFNCGEQNDAAWIDRAEIAARLVAKAAQDKPLISVSDVGCGDQKLRTTLQGIGKPSISYQGFDLLPQNEEVRKFDIDRDTLPRCDVAAVLGVLEYSADIGKPLRMLSQAADLVVVSHAVSDYRSMTPSSLRKLNWKTHLSRQEFETMLRTNGFNIIETETTSNQRSVVWLCESTGNE